LAERLRNLEGLRLFHRGGQMRMRGLFGPRLVDGAVVRIGPAHQLAVVPDHPVDLVIGLCHGVSLLKEPCSDAAARLPGAAVLRPRPSPDMFGPYDNALWGRAQHSATDQAHGHDPFADRPF